MLVTAAFVAGLAGNAEAASLASFDKPAEKLTFFTEILAALLAIFVAHLLWTVFGQRRTRPRRTPTIFMLATENLGAARAV
jgi:hypothetical protein